MEIKTKFDVGDKVWIMDSNKAIEAEIYEVCFKQRQKIGAKNIMETEITYGLKIYIYAIWASSPKENFMHLKKN